MGHRRIAAPPRKPPDDRTHKPVVAQAEPGTLPNAACQHGKAPAFGRGLLLARKQPATPFHRRRKVTLAGRSPGFRILAHALRLPPAPLHPRHDQIAAPPDAGTRTGVAVQGCSPGTVAGTAGLQGLPCCLFPILPRRGTCQLRMLYNCASIRILPFASSPGNSASPSPLQTARPTPQAPSPVTDLTRHFIVYYWLPPVLPQAPAPGSATRRTRWPHLRGGETGS